ESCPSGVGPRVWGAAANPGAPWRFLCTLHTLPEVGLLTPTLFASLAVHWLPFLIKRVAAKVDKINRMAAEGLDPTLEKMLKIIQEQAAATPGLEQHSTALAQALSANTGERHLGEALLELLQALNGLDVEVQTQFCESLASALLPCLEEPHCWWKTWKGKGCGKGKKGKHMWKGCHFPDPSQAEPAAAEEPEGPDSSQDGANSTCPRACRAGQRRAPWRLLCTLRVLREVGLLTPTLFASLAVHWLPFLIKRVAAKVDKINRMAAEGLDPTLEKMLKIIQEQAAATPGLEQHSTALAQALSANTGERHLGEALLELLQALNGLDVEVQTQFCESLASALLPCLEDTCPDGFGPGVWGVGDHRGAPWRLLCTLNVLPEVGLLTPALFATLAEHWLPFLINGAAAKLDEINQLARDGLDAAIEKVLNLIQEQAATTPGLEQSSTILAEALGADHGERRLGEALLELLLALNGLSFEVKTQFCQSLVSALLPCLEDLSLCSKGKGGGKGKKGKGKCKHMWKGCRFHAPTQSQEEPATAAPAATEQLEVPNLTVEVEEGTTTCQPEKAAEPATAVPTNEPDVPSPNVEAEDTWPNGTGAEWWAGFHGGHGGHGGHGPRKLLSTLSTLRDVGLLMPAMFASLVVHWLPFLTHFVEGKVDKINRMGAEGLDPTIQKMLQIIQEQAAATAGLEQHSALIAEALSGDNGQRRLGEAALEMLRTLSALDIEVQTRFLESVASALLPCLEDLQTQPTWPTWQTWPAWPTWPTWPMWKGKGKGKGKKGKQMWKGCHAHHAHHPHHAHAGSQAAEPAPPAPSDDEFEKKVATLLELQIATEEVIRDLLMAHNGDVTQVTELLTS
ncbi:unnamed protein product, partial [Cladocopium goreaui]